MDDDVAKIVQIKGGNGSGKTTIVKLLGSQSETWDWLEWPDGHVYATVFEDIRWVAIGKYHPDAPMGGCDCMRSIDEIKQAIVDVINQYPGYWIVLEGMMISTIKSTFYNFLREIQTRDLRPLFVILKATPEGCIRRISGRGTMRPGLSHDNIAQKCAMVVRHAKEYDPNLVRWIDVEDTPEDCMLGEFLWEVYDWKLIDAIYGIGGEE